MSAASIRAFCSDPSLIPYLERHPFVDEFEVQPMEEALRFIEGERERKVYVGRPEVEPGGLVELIDNNPLVCASAVSVPSSSATLALIAVGPLLRSGLILEPPALIANLAFEEHEIEAFFAREGWKGGAMYSYEPVYLDGVDALTAMVPIATPERLEDLDEIYDEVYGRSFFVRLGGEEWDTKLVKGAAHAVYRLRISVGEGASLLVIQVMADRAGKTGAAQVIHAMNVMCGFEESLGIA